MSCCSLYFVRVYPCFRRLAEGFVECERTEVGAFAEGHLDTRADVAIETLVNIFLSSPCSYHPNATKNLTGVEQTKTEEYNHFATFQFKWFRAAVSSAVLTHVCV